LLGPEENQASNGSPSELIDSELEDVIDDLYVHQNDEKNSDLGVRDLIKLKKRLFDPEF
jgi:hypothetical protein